MTPGIRRSFAFAAAAGALLLAVTGCAGDTNTDADTRSTSAPNASAPAPMFPGFGNSAPPTESATPQGTPTNSPGETEAVVETPDYLVYGDPNAANTIDVYSDYLCPHCATFALETQPKLIKELVDSGEAKLVIHDFLVIDPDASLLAASAARAAGEQGRYEEMQRLLMEEQQTLHEHLVADTFDVDLLSEFAERAGVPDLEKFTTDVTSSKISGAVAADIARGEQLGVQGTPWVFVNGEAATEPTVDAIRELLNG